MDEEAPAVAQPMTTEKIATTTKAIGAGTLSMMLTPGVGKQATPKKNGFKKRLTFACFHCQSNAKPLASWSFHV